MDVSAQEGIETLEKSLLNCPPLAGVITSAVVYDDRLFTDIDEQSLFKVFRPKVTGKCFMHMTPRFGGICCHKFVSCWFGFELFEFLNNFLAK